MGSADTPGLMWITPASCVIVPATPPGPKGPGPTALLTEGRFCLSRRSSVAPGTMPAKSDTENGDQAPRRPQPRTTAARDPRQSALMRHPGPDGTLDSVGMNAGVSER